MEPTDSVVEMEQGSERDNAQETVMTEDDTELVDETEIVEELGKWPFIVFNFC